MAPLDFKNYFDYNKEEGKLFWKFSKGSVKKGKEAGTLVTGGYIRVLINRKSYAVHKIIWWFEYEHWPNELDHIDGNKQNNKITNLRECTRSENCIAKSVQANNSSGVRGVHFRQDIQQWVVQFRRKGFPPIGGRFSTLDEAVAFRFRLMTTYYGPFYPGV